MSSLLPCFKTHHIRSRVPDVLNAPLAHALGRATDAPHRAAQRAIERDSFGVGLGLPLTAPHRGSLEDSFLSTTPCRFLLPSPLLFV